MKYRTVPKTGEKISILGFGCMRFPEKNGKIDEEKARTQILRAIDQGINYFDTAYPYHNGTSESFLGKVLEGGLRSKVNIATKLPQWLVHQTSDMDRFFSQQLSRLRTDCIDYYLVHAVNGPGWNRLKELGIVDWLLSLKKRGKVKNLGFSYHGNNKDFPGIVDDLDWDFCQIQYNILDDQAQAGRAGLEYAAEKKLGIMIMEPLKGGSLGGKIPLSVKNIWEESPDDVKTPAEWALSWLWDHKEITTVLSGMTEDRFLEENIRIAGKAEIGVFGPGAMEQVKRVKEEYNKLIKIGCTGCGYCIPCPFGVEIPNIFQLYNGYHMFEDKGFYREQYLGHLSGVMGNDPGYASLCKQCGKCETHCPQGLQISSLLKEVSEDMENLPFRLVRRFRRPIAAVMRWFSIRAGAGAG